MTVLEGGVAVVTGAASGIGRALAERLAIDGMRVVLADRDEPQLARAVADLTAAGHDAVGRPTDVADLASVERLASATEEAFGAPTVVCNNAGTIATGTMWDLPAEDWRRVIDVNLFGVVHGIQAFVPRLVASGAPAHVVNVASMAGVVALPGIAPYVASKHAVVGLSEALHAELRAAGAPIGVSVVCPGHVPSRLGATDRSVEPPPPAAGGRTAVDVARSIVDAVRADRFYVFTHPGSVALLQHRHDAMCDGQTPWTIDLP